MAETIYLRPTTKPTVIITGRQGPPGPPGALGGDAYYLHTQVGTSDLWTINHGLGKYPAIQLFDVTGRQFFAEVTHVTINQSTVKISPPIAGSASCS